MRQNSCVSLPCRWARQPTWLCICVCVCVNPLSPSSTPGRNSTWEGGRRREPEEEEEGGGSKLSYGAAMDEFNRSQWEGKEPIRMLHFLVVRHQFCHLDCPRRDGEKEGERAGKQYVVSFIPSHFFFLFVSPPFSFVIPPAAACRFSTKSFQYLWQLGAAVSALYTRR